MIEVPAVTREYIDIEKNKSLICTITDMQNYGLGPLDETPLPLALHSAYRKLNSFFETGFLLRRLAAVFLTRK